ncbi:hypothetical protein pEaSNUABM23_00201 [Erwinia phage pEa_SNUABM_23]|nr:hypothetical protein pEaSNUABM20_00202 [Erwinia phage pEa_SNUABM_20]UAW52983.1 hypothetical protein pEaSNUABM23_00201 [Erwinia phage pEa_SNUABM_23]UIW10879.1 hypothetical protein pEaSNUABM23_00201 [Erwinia phage pEa_SNUABM_31]
MIFGQLNRDHEKHSVPIDMGTITRNLHLFAKYEVVFNVNCMDEVEEDFYATPVHQALRMNPKKRKVLRPSNRVYLKNDQLICHPETGKFLEARLREFTAQLLDTVE